MFEEVLAQIQRRLLARQYVVTLHAEEEMNEAQLSIFDVECAIMTGTIVERQKDKVTAEWKYRFRGEIEDGSKAEVICKLSPTGKPVIVTVYTL